MAQLALLVVAAVWAAVLVPPLLRSRIENRPNSSVVDFRRQLSKLQSTSTSVRGPARAIGRPLAPSSRGRVHGELRGDARDVSLRQDGVRHGFGHAAPNVSSRHISGRDRVGRDTTVRLEREHVGLHRPATPGQARRQAPYGRDAARRDIVEYYDDVDGDLDPRRLHNRDAGGRRHHTTPHGERRRAAAEAPHRAHRAPTPAHGVRTDRHDPSAALRRRRNNVVVALMAASAGSLFLYATTESDVMMYAFAASFLALCGYLYLLGQVRQRDRVEWGGGWMEMR